MKTAELHRLIQNLCRVGTITELDHAAHKVRVKTGENITAWLQWPADIGRNFIRWRPLRVGTQIILLSPSGDISQGQIVGMLYSRDQSAPGSEETTDSVVFEDGTAINYNSADHTLTVDCTGGVVIHCTDASITASGAAIVDAASGATVTTDGNATIEAGGNAEIFASGNAVVEAGGDANVKGTTVTLQDGSAGGVVCQSHVCAFTGSPHPQGSITITGGN